MVRHQHDMIRLCLLHRQAALSQVVPPRPQQQRNPQDHHTKDQSTPFHVGNYPFGAISRHSSLFSLDVKPLVGEPDEQRLPL
jgi:hypothetical protein